MLIRNSADRFGLVTKLLHWLIAILIIFLIWLGWYMVDLTYYDKWYNASLAWHKALGMLVLGLGIAKIGWQLYSPPARAVAAMRAWERRASVIMHVLLLALMLLIPVTGYLISTSDGKSVSVFGWFLIPALIPVGPGLRDLAIDAHFWLAYSGAVLILGHVAAALKHQFFDRDGTLARMLWR